MKHNHRIGNQRGAALVVGIVLLVVATLLALVAANNTLFQERMASNQNNKTISFMAAEFGASEFIKEINAKGYDPKSDASQWSGVGTSNAPQAAGSKGGYFWANIIDHLDEANAVPLRVAIHGVSRTGPTGADLARTELHLTVDITQIPPDGGATSDAALNLIGPLGEFSAPNSNDFKVHGAKEDGQPTGPAIGVSSEEIATTLETALGPDGVDRLHNYDGGIEDMNYGDFWTNPETMRQFVNLVCSDPGNSLTATVPVRCGNTVPEDTTGRGNKKAAAMVPKITVVRGDAAVDFGGGSAGAGLLIVEGNLYMNGNPSWDGLIISLGGTISQSGGGNGQFNGSIYSLNLDTSNTASWTEKSTTDPPTCALTKPKGNKAPTCRTDENGDPIVGLIWETDGGGTADYRHDCKMVEMALGLLEPEFDNTTDPPTPRTNARALFGDSHGCGPAGGSSTGGNPETRYTLLSWVEILN